jgi:hypothetical protein
VTLFELLARQHRHEWVALEIDPADSHPVALQELARRVDGIAAPTDERQWFAC